MSEDIPESTINEIQEMIDANFGNNIPRLIQIRDELQSTSRLENKDDERFLRMTTQQWDNRNN